MTPLDAVAQFAQHAAWLGLDIWDWLFGREWVAVFCPWTWRVTWYRKSWLRRQK